MSAKTELWENKTSIKTEGGRRGARPKAAQPVYQGRNKRVLIGLNSRLSRSKLFKRLGVVLEEALNAQMAPAAAFA